MRAIVLAVLLVCALATTHRSLTQQDKQTIDTLRKSGTWAGYMINMAELHLMAQGPVDALVDGIEEVLADLEKKHEAADAAFQRRTDEHNAEVRRLNDMINEAKRQIADTEATLANVLRPQKAQLEEAIADRERFIAETHQYIEEQTAQRELDHAAYLVRVDETNGALAAIEEALSLLATLNDGAASFAQIKKVQKVMGKVTDHLKKQKGVEKYLVQALVTLATSEFADSSAVQRVADKLIEIRDNMTAAMVKDTEDEESAQASFEADMAEKAAAIEEAQGQLEDLNSQLEATEEAIADAEQFIADREADIVGYEAELDAENAAYEEATRQYNDLVAQFEKEEHACQLALEVIQNASFPEYLSNRMSQDRVIDTAHGEGIATGAGTFDFSTDAPTMN